MSCDSTAVYRGFDIGTDKVPLAERRGIPHHLIDVADPLEEYSAARYAREAAAAIRDITARGRLPILVGGTGLYYRALTRGFFPGPARDNALRARLERIADRQGPEYLHRWLQRVDPPSAVRIQSRDRKRLIRALEVYRLTGRPLTDHFADTDVAAARLRGQRLCAADSGRGDCGARRAPRRRAVPPGADGRGARAAGVRCSRDRPSVHRARLPAGARAAQTACATSRRRAS